jgi:hypothetical protein
MSVDVDSSREKIILTFEQMARQARGLAIGLQNVAPPNKEGPSYSIRYLNEVSLLLEVASHELTDAMTVRNSGYGS